MAKQVWTATGRRKRSVAQVRMTAGKGNITVNGKDVNEYPEEMLERAVKGMLPHNRLGRAMGKKLFVYANETHKHEAQKPVAIEID